MKVLVATKEMQGAVSGDYCWCVEGELVTGVVVECCEGDRCGCSRGWAGLGSSKATTTAMVVERPGLGEDDLWWAVRDYLERGGWVDLITESIDEARRAEEEGRPFDDGLVRDDPEHVIDEIVAEHVEAIEEICRSFPDGTIVSRQGTLVAARVMPDAA